MSLCGHGLGSSGNRTLWRTCSRLAFADTLLLQKKAQCWPLLIYQALIQSHFDYCNIVWGNCGITLRNKLQKLQTRAARVLTCSNYDVDAGHLFKLLGWKHLACQKQIQRATMVYKSLHGLAPEYQVLNS